jgi:tRNA pseudouridine38-40 synthase
MRTLKLTLAYDGTDFAGWQVQPGRRTVQQTLEAVLTKIAGHAVKVVASGRTDAGVHALAQVASFQTSSELPADIWLRAINAELHRDLAALAVEEAPPGFNARRDAKRKQYRYVLHDGRIRDAFSRNYAWHCFRRLDAAAMHRAAQPLVGKHDFRSFQTAGADRVRTVRTVFELTVERLAGQGVGRSAAPSHSQLPLPGVIHIEITADGFLYNMVRNIVGTLVEVGRGKRPESWPTEVLAASDRRAAAPTAPPQGLFLVRVEYD